MNGLVQTVNEALVQENADSKTDDGLRRRHRLDPLPWRSKIILVDQRVSPVDQERIAIGPHTLPDQGIQDRRIQRLCAQPGYPHEATDPCSKKSGHRLSRYLPVTELMKEMACSAGWRASARPYPAGLVGSRSSFPV